jgi:dolichol-phosphate mannosyltransferase
MNSAPVVSVVIPAYNERGTLPIVVPRVSAALEGLAHEIVLIDDGSTDGTWTTIHELREQHPSVRGIRFTRNFGHQAALAAGLRAARGGAVIMMDADGQHPPELLAEFVRLWREGHRIVQAVRTSDGTEPFVKRVSSNTFYRVWSALSGVPIVRGSADFRLLDRAVLDTVLASRGSLVFLRGLLPWLGYDTALVYFTAPGRIAGNSGYTWRRMVRFSADALTSFSVVPLRVAIGLGVLMSLLSFLYLGYILLIVAFSDSVVSGWASTAGLVALVGGIQLFTIGVLGEYVGRIFLRTTDRPEFVVAETTSWPSPDS